VPKDDRMLPPAVDVEFYGNKEKNKPDQETVRAELQSLLQSLEKYYGKKPIIYTTMKFYLNYIKGHFEDYPLWIRNVYYRPFLLEDRPWEFWQYTDKEVLEGYDGHEKYIDMNIFNGSLENFNKQFK
jgi:lysozyme